MICQVKLERKNFFKVPIFFHIPLNLKAKSDGGNGHFLHFRPICDQSVTCFVVREIQHPKGNRKRGPTKILRKGDINMFFQRKNRVLSRVISGCFFTIVLAFFHFSPAYSAAPGLELNENSGAYIWTDTAASPVTRVSHGVRVYDYDGIAADGTSHTVTVTYPNSVQRSLTFQSRINENSAYYGLNDSPISPPYTGYTGPYVYRVTRVSDNQFNEATDNVVVDPINPPDEAMFTVKLDPPQSITAHFDDVYINGVLYDDFASGLDTGKWQDPGAPSASGVSFANGEVRMVQTDRIGSTSTGLRLLNPAGVSSIQARVRVDSATSILPQARVAGYFCRDSFGDVLGAIAIKNSTAVYYVVSMVTGDHSLRKDLVPFTSLGPVTLGNSYDISITWNGTTFAFQVVGVNDAVNYTASYAPTGPLSAPVDPRKFIGLRTDFELDTTTPTFDWALVPGANHYRVRVYGMNDVSLYTVSVKSPPYTLPPGILKPYGEYKYRIYAQKEHMWFEVDNMSGSNQNRTVFITGRNEAQNPFIDLWNLGVRTWNYPPPYNHNTSFYARIHDAQGVSGNIESVKVLFPNGITEKNLYLDDNVSPTCGIYRGEYFGPIQSGSYTFTVLDRNGNSHTAAEVLTPNPIPLLSEDSLIPAHNTPIGGTGVTFAWANVPEASLYEVEIYDRDLNRLFTFRTTGTGYTIPPGVLKENSLYQYRVIASREFYEDNSDNGTASPPFGAVDYKTFFTTASSGTALPGANIDEYGVWVGHSPNPWTGASVYSLQFAVMVTDVDGVPENIERVEVTYPDGTTKRLLKYYDEPDLGYNYFDFERYTDPSAIPAGTYTFRIVDFGGNEVLLHDDLLNVAANILPSPTGLTPVSDSVLSMATPTITWNSVPGASFYRVRIYNSYGSSTIHTSGKLTETRYTVPAGVLELFSNYSYRVNAYREAVGVEVDFSSSNSHWTGTNVQFRVELPNISVSPASNDFGLINAGSKSASQTFEITNAGTSDLVIGTITVSGTDASEFTKKRDTCSGATIQPSAKCTVQAAFSPTLSGVKSASISIPSDDPDSPSLIGLTGEGTLQSEFDDCQEDHWAEDFINTLYYSGITGGCGPSNYCPDSPVTRAQMAVFIISSIGETPSTAGTNAYFDDVAEPYAGFINRMNELGITGGCGTRAYCPNDPLTRAQMSVFIIVAMGETGSTVSYNENFDDIPEGVFADFINRMTELGITGGCGGRNYCPDSSTNRAMMAVFLVTSFLGD